MFRLTLAGLLTVSVVQAQPAGGSHPAVVEGSSVAGGTARIQVLGGAFTQGAPVAASQSRIVLYRLEDGRSGATSIFVDDRYHTSLVSGAWSQLCYSSGSAEVAARQMEAVTRSSKDRYDAISALNLQAGQTHYLRVSGTDGRSVLRPVANVLTNDNQATAVTAVGAGTASGSSANVGTSLSGTYGTLTLNANGTYTYTLDNTKASVQALKAGATVNDIFTYTARDSGSTSTGSANLVITITYTAKVVDTATGNTAFASSTYNLTINSSPLVLDLNGDGVQTTALANGTQFDIDADGKVDAVGWASQQDGLLAIDLNGDGTINSGAELFGNHTVLADGTRAADGWAALAALDSNGDGKIDAQDAAFAQLRVWQDANGNGVTDAGELTSLADRGIVSIDLHANGASVAQNGNILQGFSSYTTADGAQHAVADAWLNVQQSEVITLAHGESLDLSALLASGSKLVAGVDMSQDSAANVVKLSLSDVMAAPLANGVHQLVVTGNANDTAQLNMAEWLDSGTQVTQADHSYEVYAASNGLAAQLLIDQHMLVTQHS